MIGLVYYSDDPDKKVFRRVYPSPSDNVLAVLSDPQWTTLGLPSSRAAVLVQVDESSSMALAGMTGTPMSPATQGGVVVSTAVTSSAVVG